MATTDTSPGRGASRRTRDALLAYSFLAPVLIVFAAFAYYPLYRLVYFSLYRPSRNAFKAGPDEFIGWSNISDSLTSSDFIDGLLVSVKFMAMTVPLGLVLGVLLAVAADRRLRGIRIFQTIFSSTVASSVAVASVVFFTLLQPQAGLLRNVEWLSLNNPNSALLAISFVAVWQNAGLTFIIVLAALQAVPDEMKEAAALDGYSAPRRFFQITVPLISPALMFLAIVLVIAALQAYAQFEILDPIKDAQPLLYKIADPSGVRTVSTRAVYSLAMFVITLVVSVAQFSILDRRVHYGD